MTPFFSAPWDRMQAIVAPAAFHNAAERFDPPRCHPNTRTGIMDELRDLALRRDEIVNVRVLWLNGAAGAGKSAIAQSFCEECFPSKSLLASFFFNRSDPSRNNAKSFVATLAYQIYQVVPANSQALILAVIENDPLVFGRSVDAQFTALLMNPLRDLIEGGYFVKDAPFLIVIDGLDECAKGAVQVGILTALQNISRLPHCPFVFIITSRPEHDIQMFFKSSARVLGSSLRCLTLDNSYHPDADIELFLREKVQELCATNPHKDSIPQGWPSNQVIKTLVSKSSGHFIYPSVIIKFIASDRHFPPNQLDIILGLRPPRRGHPLAELDALYSHILSSVKDVNLVLQILRIVLLSEETSVTLLIGDIDQLCNLDQGECFNALCDLQSVVRIGTALYTRIIHKSFSDYLRDPSRSYRYYIDTSPEMAIPVITQCLQIVTNPMLDYNPRLITLIRCYRHLWFSNIQMCHETLMSFSLMGFQKTRGREMGHIRVKKNLLLFSFAIVDSLCTLEGTEYEYIYRHHLHQYPELVRHYPQVYGSCFSKNRGFVLFTIFIFIALGNSEVHIPSEVFDILKPLGSWASLREMARPIKPLGFKNIARVAALRCIHSLMYDRYSDSAAFALQCLSLVLPYSKLSAEVNNACQFLDRLFAYPSTGRSLTHDFTGKPYAETGHTNAEMHKMTKELEHGACKAMQQYMERYAKRKPSDTEG